MAIAALSVASQDGKERLYALQHYQQALPALQNSLKGPEDLSSNGAFLTHFLLLVYEVRTHPPIPIFLILLRPASFQSLTFTIMMANPSRLRRLRLRFRTFGHDIFLHFCELLFCDGRSLLERYSHLSFGGFATLIWTRYSVELEAASSSDT